MVFIDTAQSACLIDRICISMPVDLICLLYLFRLVFASFPSPLFRPAVDTSSIIRQFFMNSGKALDNFNAIIVMINTKVTHTQKNSEQFWMNFTYFVVVFAGYHKNQCNQLFYYCVSYVRIGVRYKFRY